MRKARKQPRAAEPEDEPLGDGSLCGACETRATEPNCPRCETPLVLDDRWVLERKLGEGGQSRVYAARSVRDGAQAAIKVMSLDRARDWKNVELFERSANVLANLDHPGIPRFIASFRVEANAVVLFCLVHERIDGETLKAGLDRGERYDETKARQVLREVLGVLRYLHGLSPPVIHRDLKPSNLMRRNGGGLVLIDFDLVRDEGKPDGGSTIGIGTPGYAPLEQLMGEAVPATDLYALGATLVALLARKEPSALRERGAQRLDFERYVNVSKDFATLLGSMLEPAVADRAPTATAVLARLDAPSPRDKPQRRGREEARIETKAALVEKWGGLGILLFAGVLGAAELFARGGTETESTPTPQPTTNQDTTESARLTVEDSTRPAIDVARATSRLLEVRWEGKLEGRKLTLDTRREGAALVGTLTDGEKANEGAVSVSRVGKFSFRSPGLSEQGSLRSVSCQGFVTASYDAIDGSCEFTQRSGFVSQTVAPLFSLRATNSPPPAPTSAATTSAATTSPASAHPPPGSPTRKP